MAVINKLMKNPYLIKDKSIRFIVKVFRFLFIFGLCYLFLFPLFYLIIAAIQDPTAAKDTTVVWIPKVLSWDNVKLALELLNYKNSIVMSSEISVLSTLATLFSCSMVGYGFARFRFSEKKIAFAFVILLIIVPPQTTMISSYLNFRFFDFLGIIKLLSTFTGVNHVNLLNTVWTFILPSLFASGLRAGLFIFIFRQFFSGQPKELEEAATIDGCGAFATFWRIMIPLAVPAFVTVMLFSFIWHWNEDNTATMYFMDTIKPLAVQLNAVRDIFLYDAANRQHSPTQMRGCLAAGALLSVAPSLILYIFTQKYFTESVERAGIVG
jgi:multiple sugar transport system permease protein